MNNAQIPAQSPCSTIIIRVPFNSDRYNNLYEIFGERLSTEFGITGPGELPKIINDLSLLNRILKNLPNKERDNFCCYFFNIKRNKYQKLFDILNNPRKSNNSNFLEKNNILSSKKLEKYINKNIDYFVSNKIKNNITKALVSKEHKSFFIRKIIDKLHEN